MVKVFGKEHLLESPLGGLQKLARRVNGPFAACPTTVAMQAVAVISLASPVGPKPRSS